MRACPHDVQRQIDDACWWRPFGRSCSDEHVFWRASTAAPPIAAPWIVHYTQDFGARVSVSKPFKKPLLHARCGASHSKKCTITKGWSKYSTHMVELLGFLTGVRSFTKNQPLGIRQARSFVKGSAKANSVTHEGTWKIYLRNRGPELKKGRNPIQPG